MAYKAAVNGWCPTEPAPEKDVTNVNRKTKVVICKELQTFKCITASAINHACIHFIVAFCFSTPSYHNDQPKPRPECLEGSYITEAKHHGARFFTPRSPPVLHHRRGRVGHKSIAIVYSSTMVTLFFVATARRAHIQMQVTIVKGCKKLQLGHAEQEAKIYTVSH